MCFLVHSMVNVHVLNKIQQLDRMFKKQDHLYKSKFLDIFQTLSGSMLRMKGLKYINNPQRSIPRSIFEFEKDQDQVKSFLGAVAQFCKWHILLTQHGKPKATKYQVRRPQTNSNLQPASVQPLHWICAHSFTTRLTALVPVRFHSHYCTSLTNCHIFFIRLK